MLSYSATILVLSLAIGFVCSTTISLEQSYAQENPPEGGGLMPDDELSSGDLSSGGGDLSSGGGADCPSDFYESNGECFPVEQTGCPSDFYESNGECFPVEQGMCDEGYVQEGEECILEGDGISNGSQPQLGGNIPQPQPQVGKGILPPIISGPVNRIIDTDPEGFVEDTLSTINENSPVFLLIIGTAAVVAIGAGIASFSRHHHSRSSPSPSAQHQVQQDDTKKDQLYEDVHVVTQGGIEEV